MERERNSKGRRRPATIIDVASHAKVAVGTVSRYLNGFDVRQSNRDAIQGAIQALRYNRNAAAKAMRTERTNMVALLVPGYDEFFAEVLAGLTRGLSAAGQVLLTHKHEGDPRALSLALEFFQNHRVNAVVTPGVEEVAEQVDAMQHQGIPVVFFNNDVPGIDVDRVFSNNFEASRLGVRHLVDLGHRRIAHVSGGMEETTARDRLAGYRAALAEAGIAEDPMLVAGNSWQRQQADEGVARLMALVPRPTAVFTANYVLAIAVIDYCREHGIVVGRDLSLLSFDDVEMFRLMTPGISAIAQRPGLIGQTISQKIIDYIEGVHPPSGRTTIVDCTMILRQSTCPPLPN